MTENSIHFIAYPLEDAIACEICANNIHRDENGNLLAKRQWSVFKAKSRRQNYIVHLNKKHQVSVKNVKIRCSICGRISDKSSRTAWRDARTHHEREHIAGPIVEAEEARENNGDEVYVEVIAEAPVVVVESEVEVVANYDDEVPAENVVELPSVDNTTNQVNSETVENCQAEALQALQPQNVENFDNRIHALSSKSQLNNQKDSMKQHTPKKREDHFPKSTIIKGMGRMFDVIVNAAADTLALVQSTPLNVQQSAPHSKVIEENKQQELSFIAVDDKPISKIVPRARRPLKTYECKRTLFDKSSSSPRKKFCP